MPNRLISLLFVAVLAGHALFAAAQTLTPEAPTNTPGRLTGSVSACEDGLVLDDGTFETAYGWVPSVIWGEYLQTFDLRVLGSTVLETLCVCLTRTRDDDSIDFEVVLYGRAGDWPASSPRFVYPATATAVPEWPDGAFYTVDLAGSAPPVPAGTYHVGIRWDPSVDQLFFVCADHSPTENPADGFYRDDRAEGEWTSVLDTTDSIFEDHAAMLTRIEVRSVPWIPTLTWYGIGIFAALLVTAALHFFRAR